MRAAIDGAKSLCFFGIGALLVDCYPQIVMALGREPDFLSDNAQEKWGVEFFGRKCIPPSELADLCDGTVVVITVRNYEGICSQLYSMGNENVYIACYDRGYNVLNAIKRPEFDQLYPYAKASSTISVLNKWTLVTGASRGIGRKIAIEMARLGSNIIAHGRTIQHVEGVIEECVSLGVNAVPVAAELSDLITMEGMISRLGSIAPQIDIVYNNAGIPCSSDFWSLDGKDILTCLTVNAIAPIRICQSLIPPMLHRGFGRVVNISSSINGKLNEIGYACSKAALDKFVHDLAPTLKGSGVSISLADPGWLRTDMTYFKAPHSVDSVVPGVLLGALLDDDVNGRWFSAQDYAGLSIADAIQKTKFLSVCSYGNHERQNPEEKNEFHR